MTSGDILLCDLSPVMGREQGGVRPVVVVSHDRYSVIPGLFLAVPLTTRNRGLDHHVTIFADDRTGLKQVSYAMTEQIRAISAERAGRRLGRVSGETLTTISRYLHLFIALQQRVLAGVVDEQAVVAQPQARGGAVLLGPAVVHQVPHRDAAGG